jgi:tripartite-type tricarboxylate transporter receptor subunit TctC
MISYQKLQSAAAIALGTVTATAALLGGTITSTANAAPLLAALSNQPEPLRYPTRPITIIATFPPGGGTDLLARRLGASLQHDLGQRVIIENRPGASGNIGAHDVAVAAPDGYTLLMVNSSFAINPGVFQHLDFSPKNDFAPIINVAFVPSVLAVPASSPFHTLKDLLASARDKSKPLAYASCGNGTPQHLAGEMIRLGTGAFMQQVPYRGCGPALTDIVAGHVSMGIITASSASPFLQSGSLRALAVTAPARSPLMPDVPTVAEQGLPGYQLDQWHGLLAPAATPRAIVDALNAAVSHIMNDPQTRSDLLKLGFTPTASTPAAFKTLIDGDIDRFSTLTQRIGLRAD